MRVAAGTDRGSFAVRVGWERPPPGRDLGKCRATLGLRAHPGSRRSTERRLDPVIGRFLVRVQVRELLSCMSDLLAGSVRIVTLIAHNRSILGQTGHRATRR